MMYDNNEMETGKRKKEINWVVIGILEGVIICASFLLGYFYETYRITSVMEEASQGIDDFLDMLMMSIELPTLEQTAMRPMLVQNATPSSTDLIVAPPAVDLITETEDEVAEYETVEVNVRLRDLNSDDLAWLDNDGMAEVGSDQDILIWINLPDGIDELSALYRSNYPAEIKAGEEGTIDVSITCYENRTKYVGSINILATEDLSLALSNRYTKWIHSAGFYVAHKSFPAVEDESRLHTAISYSLYTSYNDGDDLYDGWGIRTSYGYDISYYINAE